MNFTINTVAKYNLDKVLNNQSEILREFFLTFPEIEIVEESIGNTIIQTYYHLSPQNIRKFKLLNINNQNDKIIELFKVLYNEELVNNFGNEKPVIWWNTGTSGSSGTSGTSGMLGKPKYKKITKKFDPHKINKGLKMKKRFKI